MGMPGRPSTGQRLKAVVPRPSIKQADHLQRKDRDETRITAPSFEGADSTLGRGPEIGVHFIQPCPLTTLPNQRAHAYHALLDAPVYTTAAAF